MGAAGSGVLGGRVAVASLSCVRDRLFNWRKAFGLVFGGFGIWLQRYRN